MNENEAFETDKIDNHNSVENSLQNDEEESQLCAGGKIAMNMITGKVCFLEILKSLVFNATSPVIGLGKKIAKNQL